MKEDEVIRNEAVLLLSALTRTTSELHKILSFQGAFDKILHIAKVEGIYEGGVIVRDALQLLSNLLKGNVANQVCFSRQADFYLSLFSSSSNSFFSKMQNYFRESAHITPFLDLIRHSSPKFFASGSEELSEGCSNFLKAMVILCHFLEQVRANI